MSDDTPVPSDDTPAPRGRKIIGWLIGLPIATVLVLLAMHALISPIPPTQKEPETHFGKPCWVCHLVSSSAKTIEVDKE